MLDNLVLLQTALIPILLYDIKSLQILDINESAISLYGYNREEFLKMTIKDLRPESEIPKLERALKENGNKKEHIHQEIFLHKRKNGEILKVEISTQSYALNGEETRLVAIKEVSEREKVLNQLLENESNLLQAQRLAKLGYWKLGLDGKYIYCSEEIYNIWESNKNEFPTEPESFLETIHPRDRSRFAKVYGELLATGNHIDFKHRILLKNNTVKWIHQRGKLRRDEENNPLFIEGTLQDITGNTLLEASLKEAKERYDYAMKATLDVIWDLNIIDGVITYSEALESLFGYEWGELKLSKKSIIDYIHPEDVERIKGSINYAVENDLIRHWKEEYRHLRKDGTYSYVSDKAFLVRNKKGKAVRMVGAMRDITDRKNSEILLKDLNKNLEAKAIELSRSNSELEQFAYVASHDLQEPLRMVKSFLELLELKYGNKLDEKAKGYINYAVDGAFRMESLIKDLLTYSLSTIDLDFKLTDLNKIINEIKNEIKINFPEKNVSILTNQLPAIIVPRIAIHQVFQNLIYNALKYQFPDVQPVINIKVNDLPDKWHFSIMDNGIGISVEYLDKIFIIFQRLHSKKEYSGSGIGLSICKKIVERLGGQIWAESVKDKGSTFHFTILKN